jgi:threonine dehydrogenase-like Zn-dependent dehydrogenase
MRGLVLNGPDDVRVETVPDPSILEPGDAIVRVTKAGICGTDLHFYHHAPSFGIVDGCRLGHEFVGVVEEVGPSVRRLKNGDKVLSPFSVSCGECRFCLENLHSSCIRGGMFGAGDMLWRQTGPVQGGQSEYVRVPLADGTLERVPEALADGMNDVRVLMLTDCLPAGYHGAAGAGIQPGDIVAVIGDGAVGLLAAHAAGLFGPAAVVLIGHHDDRLATAKQLGATQVMNARTGDAAALVAEVTSGEGSGAVVDTVGSPASMRFACEIVRPGGTLCCVGAGMFFGPPDLPWDLLHLRNISIRGGMTPVRRYLPRLLPLVEHGRLDPSPVVTDDLPLEQAPRGYDLMATRQPGTIKVAVSP